MADPWLEGLPYGECLRLPGANMVLRRSPWSSTSSPFALPVNYRLVEASGRMWIGGRARPGSIIDQGPMRVGFAMDGVDPIHHQRWSVVERGMQRYVDPDAADFRGRFDPEPWLLDQRDAAPST